jgi:GC-rich sequence DNA-binding factor
MVIDNDLTFDASEMEGAVIEEVIDMPLISQNTATETMIHSESHVKAAREKRERLRKTGVTDGEADYISLTVARKEEFDSGPHPESRLMREDDDLGEGDDGQSHQFRTLVSFSHLYSSQMMQPIRVPKNVSL